MEDDDVAPEDTGPLTMRAVIASEQDADVGLDDTESFAACRERRIREAAERASKSAASVMAAEAAPEAAEAAAAAAAPEAAEAAAAAAAVPVPEAAEAVAAAAVAVPEAGVTVPEAEPAATEGAATADNSAVSLTTEAAEKILVAMRELEEENERKQHEVETLKNQIIMMTDNMQKSRNVAVPSVKAVTAAAVVAEPTAVAAAEPVAAAAGEPAPAPAPRVVCAAAAKIVDEVAKTLGGADNVPESVKEHLGALNQETAALVWARFNQMITAMDSQASQLQTAQSNFSEMMAKHQAVIAAVPAPAPAPAPAVVQAAATATTKKRARASESLQEMLDAATKLAHKSSTPQGAGPPAAKKVTIPAAHAPAPVVPKTQPVVITASKREDTNITTLRNTIQMLRQQEAENGLDMFFD
jgi:hypothetical protein